MSLETYVQIAIAGLGGVILGAAGAYEYFKRKMPHVIGGVVVPPNQQQNFVMHLKDYHLNDSEVTINIEDPQQRY